MKAPLNVERVTLALVALPSSDVPESVDVDSIAEEALQALFKTAHEHLAAAEGFKRYGDVGPDEVSDLVAAARLVVRSILANGRIS